jgi:hypothetical protein
MRAGRDGHFGTTLYVMAISRHGRDEANSSGVSFAGPRREIVDERSPQWDSTFRSHQRSLIARQTNGRHGLMWPLRWEQQSCAVGSVPCVAVYVRQWPGGRLVVFVADQLPHCVQHAV